MANGVVSVEPERTFRVLMANFGYKVRFIQANQVIGHVLPHPQALSPSRIHTGEMLGIVEDSSPINSDAEDTVPLEQPIPHKDTDV